VKRQRISPARRANLMADADYRLHLAALPPDVRQVSDLPRPGLAFSFGALPLMSGRSPNQESSQSRKVRDFPHIERRSRKSLLLLSDNRHKLNRDLRRSTNSSAARR